MSSCDASSEVLPRLTRDGENVAFHQLHKATEIITAASEAFDTTIANMIQPKFSTSVVSVLKSVGQEGLSPFMKLVRELLSERVEGYYSELDIILTFVYLGYIRSGYIPTLKDYDTQTNSVYVKSPELEVK
jgi:hypothetical protein